jgi:hypothetical protein
MKKIVLAIGLFSIAVLSNAQKATITWGEISKKETVFQQMIAGSDGEIIKLSSEVKGGGVSLFGFGGGGATYTPVLTKYDNKFNDIKSNTFAADEKGTRMNGFLRIKNLIYLMGNKYDKETKSTSYFAQPINVNTLNTEGGLVNFGSFEARGGGWFSGPSESIVKFISSKDSSKLLVFALTPYNKKENEKYYMAVYDDNMKKLWEKTVELPYLDKFVMMYDYFVTNQGEVGVLFKHYDQEVKKESVKVDGARVPAYKTKLLIYNKTTTKPVEMVFNLNDKFVHDIDLTTDATDNLTMFGTYKIKESGHVNGYFISTIDRKTNSVSLKKMDAFPQELIELLDEDDQGSKKEKDPGLQTWFRLKHNGLRENGSLDYVLEFYRMTEHTRTDSRGSSRTYYTYEYGDIIVINVNSAGKSTFVRIPKMQYSTDFTAASGFVTLTYKNKLYFFYNDDKDNIIRDLAKKPESCTRFGKSSFVMTTVDEKGAFTREELFTNKDLAVTNCTIFCGVLSKNKISLYAQKIDALSGSKDMLGCLELK